MGKLSTPLSSNMLLFLRSFTACGRDSRCTRHLSAYIYLIKILVLCFVNQPPLFSFLVKNRARHLNICYARQTPIYLWSRCHNEDEAYIEPKNMDKANNFLGAGHTGLKPRSEYTHLNRAAQEINISTY